MNSKTKDIFSVLLVAVLLIGLTGCTNSNNNFNITKEQASETATNDTSNTPQPSVNIDQTEPSTPNEEPSKQPPSSDTITDDVNSDTPKDSNSISFDLDIGDDKHSFTILMEAVPIPDPPGFYDNYLTVTVSDSTGTGAPYQVLEDYTFGTNFQDYYVEDVNFDGYSDFYYVDTRGNVNIFFVFWVWNTKTQTFESGDKLSEISLPSFDNENEVIRGFARSSAASNTQTFYKYLDGVLTCVRIMDMGYPDMTNTDDTYSQQLTVTDYLSGNLVEVFNKTAIIKVNQDNFEGEIYDEFFKWDDLDYHGEI